MAVASAAIVTRASADKASDDAAIDRMFVLAKNHDVAGLKGLESAANSSASRTVKIAFAVALYEADPNEMKAQFVLNFPDDPPGIMDRLYNQIELATTSTGERRTPTFLFSFDSLGKLALAGDALAREKLLKVAANSDAAVAEFICERVVSLTIADANGALQAIGKLDPEERRSVVDACFGEASSSDETTAALEALERLGSPSASELTGEIRNAVAR
jgi:hypothetical protein